MDYLLKKYRPYIGDRKFLASLGMAVLFLMAGIVVTFFAIVYATESASNSVTDIILNNIRIFDVDGIFVYGPILFWIVIAIYPLVFEPKKLPFTIKSIALFLLIRSVFISLTHIGPFPAHAQVDTSGIIGIFTYGSDLFFSSHTGLPFLMALVFWDNKYLRLFCILASLFFGAVVLMAHLHYSIDVLGAFFITYTIFHLSKKFFKKDLQFFNA